MAIKPPMGISTEQVWEERGLFERCKALIDALHRYQDILPDQPITRQWAAELTVKLDKLHIMNVKRENL